MLDEFTKAAESFDWAAKYPRAVNVVYANKFRAITSHAESLFTKTGPTAVYA